MQHGAYEKFATITGQLYFCSMPIRVDSYNRCQFGCTYCFSRRRAQNTSLHNAKTADPGVLRRRLKRAQEGPIVSALDEFLANRIPIQLGGMHDPFTPAERHYKISFDLLRTLSEFNYPTAISTKGALVIEPAYTTILKNGPFFVRFSASGVRETYRKSVDYKCDSFDRTLHKIEKLSAQNIPTSLRIQPVIPSFEDDALQMATRAADAGAKHISFEYLKIPSESRDELINSLCLATGVDVSRLIETGAYQRVGYDYALRSELKISFVADAEATCRKAGVRFGAGDTEFIHKSDGAGCCGSPDLFLQDTKPFVSNLTGAIKHRECDDRLFFSDFKKLWQPTRCVSAALSSRSRGKGVYGEFPDWFALMSHRWNGKKSIYTPDFFYGVEWHGETDNDGYKVYRVDRDKAPRFKNGKRPD